MRRAVWRLLVCLGYTAFAYPFALVTVPLAVLLVGHAVLAIVGRFGTTTATEHHSPSGCAACLAGIATFAIVTSVYLLAAIVQGWRNSSGKHSH